MALNAGTLSQLDSIEVGLEDAPPERSSDSAHNKHAAASNDDNVKAKRACVGCNRKKTKCDMTLPVCSSCSKANSACVYPTSRKRRTTQPHSPKRRQSVSQQISKNFDTLFHLLSSNSNKQADSTESPVDVPRRSKYQKSSDDRSNNSGNFNVDFESYIDMSQSGSAPEEEYPSPIQLASTRTPPEGQGQQRDNNNSSSNIPHDNNSLFSNTGNAVDLWQNDSSLNMDDGNMPHLPFVNFEFYSALGLDLFQNLAGSRNHNENSGLDSSGNWGANGGGTLVQQPVVSDASLYQVDIPWSLLEELVDLYFVKAHLAIPVLHRPRFKRRYLSNPGQLFRPDDPSALETSLLLHAILATAARFSKSSHFEGTEPSRRGDGFAEKAKAIYHECLRSMRRSTIEYLQGCTILAFHLYATAPDSQGWLLIGMCSRMAYELELHKTDIDDEVDLADLNPLAWSRKEELRRLWWSIWELDTFSSAFACRPHTFDRNKIYVKLPVSDKDWFTDTPVESSVINPNPLHAWHCLRDCQNQDERAWFLNINYLLLIAHDLSQEPKADRKAIEDIDRAVTCFVLLLPPVFHLAEDASSITFNAGNFAQSNWIFQTNIMVQGTRTFIKFISESVSKATPVSPGNHLLEPLAARNQFGIGIDNYRPHAEQLFHTISLWSPAYIPYCSPFIAGLLLGPAAIFLRVAMASRRTTDAPTTSSTMEVELIKLALSHIARYWGLASHLLGIVETVVSSR